MAEYLIQDTTLNAIANAIRAKTKKNGLISGINLANEISDITLGVELNFEVIGSTSRPQNPTENTIWVNSNTDINGWVFKENAPAEANEGQVWILTNAASIAPFNALKVNNIEVYPISVNQYINGAWEFKESYIYKGGSWTQLTTERILFDGSNPFTGMTDIWQALNNGSIDETQLDIACYWSHAGAEVYTADAIDLSLFSTLHVQTGTYHGPSYVGILTSMVDTSSLTSYDANYAACAAKTQINKANTEFTLDLSSINSGEYHIWIGNTGGGVESAYGCYVTKVWLTMD